MTAAALTSRVTSGAAVVAVGAAIGMMAALRPNDVWALSVVLALSVLVIVWLRERRDQSWAAANWPYVLVLAVAARLLAGCAHLVVAFIVFGGNVDLTGYQNWVALAAANVLRGDFVSLQSESTFFFVDEYAVGYLLVPFYLVLGPSLLGLVFLSALIGFLGSFLFLRAFQVAGPPEGDVRFFGSMMFFLPTFVFWGTLFGKDSVMFLCLATVAYGFAKLVKGQATAAVMLGSGTCLFVAIAIRSHMGLALLVGLGVAWLLRPSKLYGAALVLRPLQGFVRVAIVCVIVAGPTYALFEHFGGPESLVKQIVMRHMILSSESTDLSITIGSSLPPRITGESPWEFVTFLPEGFLTALYRPLPFDVHNAPAAVAAIEGTALLAVTVRRRRQLVRSFRDAWSNPFMMFCVVYFLIGTWLLSLHRNLGLITRQRTMVLPFLVIMLAAFVSRREPVRVPPAEHGSMVPTEPRS